MRREVSVVVFLAMGMLTVTYAQGLMPVPDITGATIQSTVEFRPGFPRPGTFAYRYTIRNPVSSTGEIWMLEVDVSSAYTEQDELNATFPMQGGATTVSAAEWIDLVKPFSGVRGPSVIFVGQSAPYGWNGGLNRRGNSVFAASDRAYSLQPGGTQGGFGISSRRPPTIRQVSVEPLWVPLFDDVELVTEAESIAARETQESLPIVSFALGPTDFASIERLREDLLKAEALGWISNRDLLGDLLTALDAAADARNTGDELSVRARLQEFIYAVVAASAEAMSPEALELAVLNAEYLISTGNAGAARSVAQEPLAGLEARAVRPESDLVVSVFVPPVILASSGATIYLTDQTDNIGRGGATESTITRYFISATTPVNPDTATVLGERTVPPLRAGSYDARQQTPFVIPAGFDNEVNYLLACADSGQDIVERDERNNCSSSEFGMRFAPTGVMK